ncbi:MAG TPA: VCBS repeat-containing protein, partial [Polyangiaceae bacterium]|nr:VCBS repeat-containing protein [Polyangiaceae bacterium]
GSGSSGEGGGAQGGSPTWVSGGGDSEGGNAGNTSETAGSTAGGSSGAVDAGTGGTSFEVNELSFQAHVVDDRFTGENKALGDVDGDGLLDLLVGGPLLRWYQAPSWVAHDVGGSDGYLTSHMRVADMNQDGALDVISPDDFEVYWFENPSGKMLGKLDDPWPRHLVGDHGQLVHELWVVDLDCDGKLDVIGNPSLELWIQGATPDTWKSVELNSVGWNQGLAVGKVDGDARPDLVVRGAWLKTPADPTDPSAFVAYEVDAGMYSSSSIQIADVDENGVVDLVYAPMEIGEGELAWYSAADPTGAWQRHSVGTVNYVHDFAVVDIDGKGRPDIVFAEMSPSPTARVGVFLNHGADQWALDVLATTGSHNIVTGDLGNDCDLDIAGANWNVPPVEIWENLASPPGTSCPP